MAGRPPKPTRLKIIHGNPGRRPLNTNEPQPDPTLTKPRWLTGVAAKEWRRLAPELKRLGLATMADRNALAAYCVAFARWREAEDALSAAGSLTVQLETKTGSTYFQPRPEVSIAAKYFDQMMKIGGRFGLDPSSRSKLSTPQREAVDPFAEFLGQTNKEAAAQ